MILGRNLKKLRKSRGYSLRVLAERSGVAFSTISRIERQHQTDAVLSTAFALCRGLEVDFFDLVKEE